MYYYRIWTATEDYWICEECKLHGGHEGEIIDSGSDKFGDKCCDVCGACYDNDYQPEDLEIEDYA